MVQSKNHDIVKSMQVRKKEKETGEGAIKDDTESEMLGDDPFKSVHSSDEGSGEEDFGCESTDKSAMDAYGNKIARKLKPSGVVTSILIDPDETSDEENDPVAKMRLKEEVKKTFGEDKRPS